MKKLIPLIFAMLLLCGCSSLLDTSYTTITPHTSTPAENEDAPVYIEVSKYSDLQDAMNTLVSAHAEDGIIRFTAYEGDVEQDLNNACINITNNTAIGTYAVSYIDKTLNRYVSYYEAAISIIYKKDASQINSIIDISSQDGLEAALENALNSYASSIAIRTRETNITAETINSTLNELYYSDPELIVALPVMDITEYYDASRIVRIYEISLTYPLPTEEMETKIGVFDTIRNQLAYEFDDTENKNELLYQLCTYLSDEVEYTGTVPDEEYDRFDMVNTAYGALYEREASGEGFAMALKLLCNWYDIDCVVVTGRYNNYIHAWNMIKVDGDWYHFDITKLKNSPSKALLLTDKKMDNNYSWDVVTFSENGEAPEIIICDGKLNYTYFTDSTSQTEPTPPESPSDNSETTQG